MKTLVILVLSNVVLIESAPNCCKNDNVANSSSICSDGVPSRISHCLDTYLIETIDNSTSLVVDLNNNLIIDSDYEDVIPEHHYCFTTLQDGQIEVYIICYNDTSADEGNSRNFKIMLDLCLELISVFFIILTVATYLSIPPLLDLQGINIIHSISGLACGFIMLSVINFSSGHHIDSTECHILAYLLYTSFMYAFFWLNLISFHIWKQVINPKILSKFKSWKLIYHCYAMGGTLLLFIFLVSVHHANSPHLKHIHPGIGQVSCWFKSPRETLIYFYAPMAVLLTVNVVYFAWTALVLRKRAATLPNGRILKYRVRLYVKLFFVMGLSWIFEAIQGFMFTGQGWFWDIIDVINSLKGVIIFLVLVVFRKKVIRHLANKKIFAKCNYITKWQQIHDSESEDVQEGLDLESQSMNQKEIARTAD